MPIAAKLVALLRHCPGSPAMAGPPAEHRVGTLTPRLRPASAIEPATERMTAKPADPGTGAVVFV